MERRVLLTVACLLGLPTGAVAQGVPSVTYALTPQGSDVYVVIRNDTSATASSLGHDHVIYARDFTGTVVWPTAPGGTCSVRISVPVGVDEDDKVKVQRNMWSGGQLSSTQFPAVTFTADHCPGGTGTVPVSGTMTIRGVAKPVTVPMTVTADGTSFSASGKFESAHSTFGFKPFAATAFGPRNQDRLSFHVSVKGQAH
jgi:polyisoprenoid-binding protein YceI